MPQKVRVTPMLFRSLFVILLVSACGYARPAAAAEATPARPNVVFVLCDDLRQDCLGVAGPPSPETPNIDRLTGAKPWKATESQRLYAGSQ